MAATSPPQRTGPNVALSGVIGVIGTAIFLWLGLPLPFFLGALVATMIAAVAGLPVGLPKQAGEVLRAILGVAIGGAFAPELLARGQPIFMSLAFLLPWLGLLVGCGYFYFRARAGLDRPTAFFSAVPGGMSDMVLLAQDSGANVRAVTLIHLARNCLVVFALPLYLQWHDGLSAGRQAFTAGSHLSDLSLGGALELVLLGVIGTSLARWLGLTGPAIIGPMILSGLAHVLGATAATMPIEIMMPTQILLGILLGAQFKGLNRHEVRTALSHGLVFTAALLAITPPFAAMVAWFSGQSPVLTVMGFAPGGQAEVNLLAFALHLDVAFIALHHLTRVALVMVAAQIVMRSNGRTWS